MHFPCHKQILMLIETEFMQLPECWKLNIPSHSMKGDCWLCIISGPQWLYQHLYVQILQLKNVAFSPSLGFETILFFCNNNHLFAFCPPTIPSFPFPSPLHQSYQTPFLSLCLLSPVQYAQEPPQLCYRLQKSPSIRHNHNSRSMITLKANFQSMWGPSHRMYRFSLSQPTPLSVETKAIYSSPKALLATASWVS